VYSYVFLFGDLNFRIDDLSADEVRARIDVGDIESLWPYDQVCDMSRNIDCRWVLSTVGVCLGLCPQKNVLNRLWLRCYCSILSCHFH